MFVEHCSLTILQIVTEKTEFELNSSKKGSQTVVDQQQKNTVRSVKFGRLLQKKEKQQKKLSRGFG